MSICESIRSRNCSKGVNEIVKIYLTLNPDKDKDRAIIDYLEQQYSKSGTIKSLLYQVSVNDGNIPTITANSKEEKLEQKTVESSRKINLSEFL